MDLKGYFQLAYKSYWGNALVIGLPFTLAQFSLDVSLWLDGKITSAHLLRMFLLCAPGGLAVTAFTYYVLLRPYMRRRGFTYEDMKREHDERQRQRK